MDLSQLPALMPLGGASVLLVYLLRMIAYERERWIRERQVLIEEHRAEMALRDVELARHDAECEKNMAQWRTRYDTLMEDYDRLATSKGRYRGIDDDH